MRAQTVGAVTTIAAMMGYPELAHAGAARCMAQVLGDVSAEEAHEEVKSKGSADFGPITQVKVNKKTGRMTYCGHNTYCYNSNAFQWTTPCRLKLDKSVTDQTFFVYFTR